MTNRAELAAYDRRLARAVMSAVRDGARDFGSLLDCLAGASPVDLRTTVGRLAAWGTLDPQLVSTLLGESVPHGRPQGDAVDDLPSPHPLDADWRFTPATARAIADEARKGSRKPSIIVLLGVPTVFRELVGDRAGGVVLLERSGSTITGLEPMSPPGSVTRCDVARDKLPELSADMVVADPPWYPEDMKPFIWAAASLAREHATVLFSIPPKLVRPGIARERQGVFEFASRCGLEVVSVQRGVLRYTTPAFERNALRAAGFKGEYPDWRVGDLVVFRAHRGQLPRRPNQPVGERWRFEQISGTTIAFRDEWPQRADPRLVRIVPGDVLSSVSRRDPVRARVRVWTTGNRVFGCADPLLAAALTRALVAQVDPIAAAGIHLGRSLSGSERRLAVLATSQLRDLVTLEATTRRAHSLVLAS